MSGELYQVRHETKIRYAAPIGQAQLNLRLRPIGWPGQSLRAQQLEIVPQPAQLSETTGPYPVKLTRAGFTEPLAELTVTSTFEIAVDIAPPPVPGPELEALRAAALASRDLSNLSPVPYLFASRIVTDEPEVAAWARELAAGETDALALARKLAKTIHDTFEYEPGTTTSATPPIQSFAARAGVCQDFAHILIMALRALGIPAAYVSGYLRTVPPPGEERLVGADAMHAWVNVWLGEGIGWVGIDPTNDCLALSDHILVAMGRDYADVAPIDGVFIGRAPQAMKVAVDVISLR